MNASRTEILARIRRALINPNRTHWHGDQPQVINTERLFASSTIDSSLTASRFQEESEQVGGETTLCPNIHSALRSIQDLILASGYSQVAISNHEICLHHQLIKKLSAILPKVRFVTERLDSENRFARQRNSRNIAQVDLAITGAEYLIADTGTIVLTTNLDASRQMSLLPRAHLVLATSDQIYPNLATLLNQMESTLIPGHLPTALTLITGPSRTADIEKVLIKGAHGPVRQLTFVLNANNPKEEPGFKR